MITVKITSKAQATIPQPVRIALGLQEGDSHRWWGPTKITTAEVRDVEAVGELDDGLTAKSCGVIGRRACGGPVPPPAERVLWRSPDGPA